MHAILANLLLAGILGAAFLFMATVVGVLWVKHGRATAAHKATLLALGAEKSAHATTKAAQQSKRERSPTEIGMDIADRAALKAVELAQGPPRAHPSTGVLVATMSDHLSAGFALLSDMRAAIEQHRREVWGEHAPAAVVAPEAAPAQVAVEGSTVHDATNGTATAP
jgi:hypothetical protein